MHLSTPLELSSNHHYKYLLITYLVCTTVYISSFWNILYLQMKYLFIITYLVCTTACICSFWVILYTPLQICIHYLSCTYLYKQTLTHYISCTHYYIYLFLFYYLVPTTTNIYSYHFSWVHIPTSVYLSYTHQPWIVTPIYLSLHTTTNIYSCLFILYTTPFQIFTPVYLYIYFIYLLLFTYLVYPLHI